jgi:predicted nucleic acid-binding protein
LADPEKTISWRVLFDLNIILDVLMRREPHFADAARLWALAESSQIEGFLTAHSFTTLFYLYRRQSDFAGAYQIIRKLLRVFDVAGIDGQIIETACDLGWRDFEDAVQAMAASGASCDYLVTRNPEDYASLPVTVIEPATFLAVWAGKEGDEDSS